MATGGSSKESPGVAPTNLMVVSDVTRLAPDRPVGWIPSVAMADIRPYQPAGVSRRPTVDARAVGRRSESRDNPFMESASSLIAQEIMGRVSRLKLRSGRKPLAPPNPCSIDDDYLVFEAARSDPKPVLARVRAIFASVGADLPDSRIKSDIAPCTMAHGRSSRPVPPRIGSAGTMRMMSSRSSKDQEPGDFATSVSTHSTVG